MTARLHEATLDHALQIARDAGACENCRGHGSVDAPHCGGRTCAGSLWPERTPGPRVCTCECSMCDPLCRTCGTIGVVGELSPDVVTWLARLALHHPQVSAAVAAALPSSGVRWAGVWSDVGHASGYTSSVTVRCGVNGEPVGHVVDRRGAFAWETGSASGVRPRRDAARAEVDERLIAAGYTLLGEVYRRAPTFRDLADAAERDMPAGMLAGPPDATRTCPRCMGSGDSSVGRTCTLCDGSGDVPVNPAEEPCRDCNGYGWADMRAMTDPCRRCGGTGVPRG